MAISEPPPDAPQALLGFLSNDAWQALLADLDARIEQMETLADEGARQQVFELLNSIDAVHREALHRLVRLFKEGVLEKVVTDPAIHTLMELYDLLPGVPLPAPARPAFPTIPIRAVRAPAPAAPQHYPHWVPAPVRGDELPVGGLHDDVSIDGLPMLLAVRDGQWFALDAACPVDGQPLRGARLSGYTLSCPRHAGCHYDIRNGARIGGGPGIACHSVKADAQGRLLVGLGMDFKPALPAF